MLASRWLDTHLGRDKASPKKHNRCVSQLVNSAVRSVWSSMLDDGRSVASASMQFQMNVIVPFQLSLLCAREFWSTRKDENLKEN